MSHLAGMDLPLAEITAIEDALNTMQAMIPNTVWEEPSSLPTIETVIRALTILRRLRNAKQIRTLMTVPEEAT